MSQWDEAQHPRQHDGQFASKDASRPEHTGASVYAVAVAPQFHGDWRGSQMHPETGWAAPVMVDGVDVANTNFHQLPEGTRERIALALDGADDPSDDIRAMAKGNDASPIAAKVFEHEAAGGSITREGDAVIWRLNGQPGTEDGYAVFGIGHKSYYRGNLRQFKVSDDGDDLEVDDVGSVSGETAHMHAPGWPRYIAPSIVRWQDGTFDTPETIKNFDALYESQYVEARRHLRNLAQAISDE